VSEELILKGIDVPVIKPMYTAVAIDEIVCELGHPYFKHTWLQPPTISLPGSRDLEFI
jgi:hypothetical protein